jgi:hypothetical protein
MLLAFDTSTNTAGTAIGVGAGPIEVGISTDKAADRSWRDRLQHRLEGCRAIVARLQKSANWSDMLILVTYDEKIQRFVVGDQDRRRGHHWLSRWSGSTTRNADVAATRAVTGCARRRTWKCTRAGDNGLMVAGRWWRA